MSVEAITWALNDAPVDNSLDELVLLGLANHAHPDGSAAFPSQATLARYARCTERTVRNALSRLLDAGVIAYGNPHIVAAYVARPDRRPTCYDLDLTRTRNDRNETPGGNAEPDEGNAATGTGGISEPQREERRSAEPSRGTVLEEPSKEPSEGARAREAEPRHGHRLPDGWRPDPEPELVAELGGQQPARREFDKFCDYWRSQPGARGRKRDWQATWRNWLRKAVEDRPKQRAPQKNAARFEAAADALAEQGGQQ